MVDTEFEYDQLPPRQRRSSPPEDPVCSTCACLALIGMIVFFVLAVIFIVLYARNVSQCPPKPPPITQTGSCDDPIPVTCNSTRTYSLVDFGHNVTLAEQELCCQNNPVQWEIAAFFALDIGSVGTRVLLSTCGIMPQQDSVMHVYFEQCSLTCEQCDDDSCGLGSFVALNNVTDTRVIIGITSFNNDWQGMNFPLTITCFDEDAIIDTASQSLKPPPPSCPPPPPPPSI